VNPVVLVGAGGVCGAIARHLVGERVPDRFAATLVVNVCGSFALGVVLATPLDDAPLLTLGTGFCGAFTTFSTFAFETVRLFETGHRKRALANAAGTLVAAVLAVTAGATLAGVLS